MKPVDYSLRIMNLCPRGKYGSIDHHHGQSQVTRGFDLGVCTRPASVFRHDRVNFKLLQNRTIRSHREGPSRNQYMVVGKTLWSFRRIHQSQQIEVLRIWGELIQMHTPDSQHYAFCLPFQRRNSTRNVGNPGPSVSILGRPGRSCQSDHRNLGARTGRYSIPAHLGREGVRCIDHMGHMMVAQIRGKALRATEPSYPAGDRMPRRPLDPARERYGGLNAIFSQPLTQGRGFNGAAQNKEVWGHV